jgi:hypothetical protein
MQISINMCQSKSFDISGYPKWTNEEVWKGAKGKPIAEVELDRTYTEEGADCFKHSLPHKDKV